MQDERALTDGDVDAINQAEEEMDRGAHVEFDSFAADMRKNYCRGVELTASTDACWRRFAPA